VYFSFVAGGPPDAGWFAYPPLSDRAFAGRGMDYYVLGLAVNGAGTIIGAINIAATILLLRCPGMSITRLPLFVWMSLVTSLLILAATRRSRAAWSCCSPTGCSGRTSSTPRPRRPGALAARVLVLRAPRGYIVILPAFG